MNPNYVVSSTLSR